jgi:hypothetical protein
MCAGVEYREPSGKDWKVYFPSPKAALPVNRGESVEWVKWGRRSALEEGKGFLVTGWARQQSVLDGKWDRYCPEFVTLAGQSFMEKEKVPTSDPLHPNRKPTRKSHWFNIEPGKAIQALIAHVGNEKRLYVVTVPLPEEFAWLEHDRWPALFKISIKTF